jgi:hypothetical protein
MKLSPLFLQQLHLNIERQQEISCIVCLYSKKPYIASLNSDIGDSIIICIIEAILTDIFVSSKLQTSSASHVISITVN